jgi:hypothetical protein
LKIHSEDQETTSMPLWDKIPREAAWVIYTAWKSINSNFSFFPVEILQLILIFLGETLLLDFKEAVLTSSRTFD